MSPFQTLLSVLDRVLAALGLFLLTVASANIINRQYSSHRAITYPPGPESRPIFGNTHHIPANKPWITYAQWAKQYGSLIHIKDYSKHVIIINSFKDAVNLLEKRSNIYSDRPASIMIKLMGWDFNVGLMPYGDEWRRRRKILQKYFKKDIAVVYQPIQTQKIHDMLRNILETPEDFISHYKTQKSSVAAAIIMSCVYGHDISRTNDYYVSLSEAAVEKLSETFFPGAVAVNAIPSLQYIPSWFPGAGFKRFATKTKDLTDKLQNMPYNHVRENMSQGVAATSILADLLRENDARGGSKEVEDGIKAASATSYAAGADTTTSNIGTFIYAMTRNPSVQQKAQQEIDNLTGGQRLPNHDDRNSLPYVEALFREVMRWRPVLPLGVAHAALNDDVYNGYYIPKGSTVISNIWAMTHDESIYTEPDAFKPERFINGDGKLNDDDLTFVFGFGRRICVGRHMASSTVWLITASILAVFNIRRDKDELSNEILPTVDYTDGLVSHPLPFRCSITPRSDELAKLVMEVEIE
ncbi:cytochrome P450 [Collybia nuda]|uniref:Cytochrome P450 n=1 Tax=Collybia nuda TaxID=64659 RepID=A0A9P6CKN0_9AGAR|nr:cytochrome P450 [Collybia nuda]